MKKLRIAAVIISAVCGVSLLTLRVNVKPKAANSKTTSAPQSFVLKRVGEPKGDPPCSTWGNITSCDPNGGSISWGPSINTTYTWTAPPEQIGPQGISISLSASESNPPDRASATGIKLIASGFDLSGGKPDAPIGRQSLSGSTNVILKPQRGAGEYSIRIGVYWGPSYVYTYRPEASSSSSSGSKAATKIGNSALSDAARAAIDDPNFQVEPMHCSGFVNRIVGKVYGRKYSKLFGVSAKVTYANFKTNGLAANTQELLPGDILFQPTLGVYGHIAIFVGDGVIAEDGCGGKSYRTVNAFGGYQAVGRLPPP